MMNCASKPQSNRKYNLEQSPFYKLSTKKRLATIFDMDVKELVKLASKTKDNYRSFPLTQSPLVEHPLFSKKPREVQQLKPALDRVHQRIYKLIRRIEVPAYLHSAIKGRSYATNAREHIQSPPGMTYNIDIKKFYQNVRQVSIYHFFAHTMRCSVDVAYILSMVCSYKGVIPTGSCLSPLLSYFVNKNMFDALHSLASSFNLKMTVYVDDVVFSGQNITDRMTYALDSMVKSHGYFPHKQKLFKRHHVKIITGLAVVGCIVNVPSRRLAKLRLIINALRHEHSDKRKMVLSRSLLGMVNEISQFNPGIARSAANEGARLCFQLRPRFLTLIRKLARERSAATIAQTS